MQAAYEGVMNWQVSNDQANPDRGTYKDALQASTASKFTDYEISKGLLDAVGQAQERASNVDTRNTKELMTAEHGFKLEGMEKANTLSKDYLGAQTNSDVTKIRATGQETRETDSNKAEEERDSYTHKQQTDFTLARSGLKR
jgi:hypothetical protein